MMTFKQFERRSSQLLAKWDEAQDRINYYQKCQSITGKTSGNVRGLSCAKRDLKAAQSAYFNHLES